MPETPLLEKDILSSTSAYPGSTTLDSLAVVNETSWLQGEALFTGVDSTFRSPELEENGRYTNAAECYSETDALNALEDVISKVLAGLNAIESAPELRAIENEVMDLRLITGETRERLETQPSGKRHIPFTRVLNQARDKVLDVQTTFIILSKRMKKSCLELQGLKEQFINDYPVNLKPLMNHEDSAFLRRRHPPSHSLVSLMCHLP